MRFTGVCVGLVAVLVGVSGCGKQPGAQSSSQHLQPVPSSLMRALKLEIAAGKPPSLNRPLEEQLDSLGETCEGYKQLLPPEAVKQGTVEVPEDWNKPEGRKIHVFYYSYDPTAGDGLLTADPEPAGHTPVVFFNGGPAADSHSGFAALGDRIYSSKIPFVFIDQRGTGCSDAFPTEPTAETIERLTHYGSRAIVQDAEAVRKALYKDKKWRAFGQSYGGDIVHRYAMTQSQGLEAAFSHGASLMTDPVQWGIHRIRSQHRVTEDYFAQYPDDRALVAKLRALIKQDQCFDDGSARICGAAVLDAATALLGFHDSWPRLHDDFGMLANIDEAGEVSLNADTLNRWVRAYVFGIFANNALAGSVISKLEMVAGYSDRALCSRVLDTLDKAGEKPREWAINECRLLTTLELGNQDLIEKMSAKDPLTPAAFKSALEAAPALRFFLYSGAKDVFSPVASFEEEVKLLGSRITYRNFETSGHEGFKTEDAVWADLRSR